MTRTPVNFEGGGDHQNIAFQTRSLAILIEKNRDAEIGDV